MSSDEKAIDLENSIRNIIKNSIYNSDQKVPSDVKVNQITLDENKENKIVKSENLENYTPIKSKDLNLKELQKPTKNANFKKIKNQDDFDNLFIPNNNKQKDLKKEKSRNILFSDIYESPGIYKNFQKKRKVKNMFEIQKNINNNNHLENENYFKNSKQKIQNIEKDTNDEFQGTPYFPNPYEHFLFTKEDIKSNDKKITGKYSYFDENNNIYNIGLNKNISLNEDINNNIKETIHNNFCNNDENQKCIKNNQNTIDDSMNNQMVSTISNRIKNINLKKGDSDKNQYFKNEFEKTFGNFNLKILKEHQNNKDSEICDYKKKSTKKIDKDASIKQKYYISNRNLEILNNFPINYNKYKKNADHIQNNLNSNFYNQKIVDSYEKKNEDYSNDISTNEKINKTNGSLFITNPPNIDSHYINYNPKRKNYFTEICEGSNHYRNTDLSDNKLLRNISRDKTLTNSNVNASIDRSEFIPFKNNEKILITKLEEKNLLNFRNLTNDRNISSVNKIYLDNINFLEDKINKLNDDNNINEFLNNLNKKNKNLKNKLNEINKIKLELKCKNKIISQYENMNISLRKEMEALNKTIEQNKLQNIDWLKQFELIKEKVTKQEKENLNSKEEKDNMKIKLEEKEFKHEILENKLKNLKLDNKKMQDLHSQYEKNLIELKLDYKQKEENYKIKIEEANNILIIKLKEHQKENENQNEKNLKIIKELEAEINE